MEDIILTEGQVQGLNIAVERYNKRKPFTVIAGYAGTGKSTLVQHIINKLQEKKRLKPAYVAYTGKAAMVLKNKGCDGAKTVHKLIYDVLIDSKGNVSFHKKDTLGGYNLIICDEASMLPQKIIDDLLSYHIHVVFLGDPGQLPPIEGDQTLLKEPHVMLTEIMRQEENNPIIRLSMDARNGKPLSYGKVPGCRIIPESRVNDKLLIGADQVICGKNATRHILNERMRRAKFGDSYSAEPLEGDKVICLKNQWDVIGSQKDPLMNGCIGVLKNIRIGDQFYGTAIKADFYSEDGNVYRNISIDYQQLIDHKPIVTFENLKEFKKRKVQPPIPFDFGYAITCHKYQGSEANRVLVYNEAFGTYDDKKKWLYTAITRAKEQLIIVK